MDVHLHAWSLRLAAVNDTNEAMELAAEMTTAVELYESLA